MIKELPACLNILFGFTVVLSIGWFYLATRSRKFLILASAWTILQSVLGLSCRSDCPFWAPGGAEAIVNTKKNHKH